MLEQYFQVTFLKVLKDSDINGPFAPLCSGSIYEDVMKYIRDQKSGRVKYNSRLDQLVDVFYFWVRNTTSIPQNSVVTRRNTTSAVANFLSNPQGLGLKFFAPTDTNKLLVGNIRNLAESQIVCQPSEWESQKEQASANRGL